MAGKPLSNVDAAWLRMEDPTNLMMITGIMTFGAPIDYERLKKTLDARLMRFSRFYQRVIPPKNSLDHPYWEDDPDFSWDYHIQRIRLPEPADKAELQKVVSKLMSTQLDFNRPLWQYHLVENYAEGAAVIARFHHCIADGIALMHVLLSLTDDCSDAPCPEPEERKPRRTSEGMLESIFKPANRAFETTSRITDTILEESLKTLINPRHALDLARLGTKGAAALGRLVLRWPDPKTLFKGPLGRAKKAAWSEPIPLKDIKSIGVFLDGTVNDVLLAAVTGALRKYMIERGESVEDINIRGVIPVNLRPFELAENLGNQFGLVFLSLPLFIEDPVKRLHELKRRMDEIKNTPEAAVAFGILNTIGMAPEKIEDIVVDIFGTKGTAVMTNVPGPKNQLYMCGAPLTTVLAWVPQSGHLGLGVSIISYAGKVWLGMATDEGLVPDPEKIVENFQQEFANYRAIIEGKLANRSSRTKEMLAALDQAIASVDDMIVEANRCCEAITKAGTPCKSRPERGSRYCRVHTRQLKAREAVR